MRFGKALFLFIIFLLAACSGNIDTNMSEPMAEFEFTTHDGDILSLSDLEGEWWITNLMYTDCRTICPRTTTNLVDVQQKLKEDDLHPQIISFSIDPSYDSPEILKEYARQYDVDLETWDFLTGYNFETIQKISQNTFKSTLEKGASGQRSHGYSFYLIDPYGDIVKKYDGMSTDELNILVDDLKIILSKT